MARTGRPRKNIDKAEFEKLCALQCTLEEICGFFDCNENTVNAFCKRTYKKTFSEVFRLKRGTGKISLRRRQWKLAETSASMAIWLGKQYLGQTDNPSENADIEDTDNYFGEAGLNE